MISTLEPTGSASVPFGQQLQSLPFTTGFAFSSENFCTVTMPGQFMPATSQPASTGIKLRAAIDEVMAAKKAADLRPHSIEVMRHVLNQFARGREDSTLVSISAKDIQDWLDSLKVKPCTKRSNVTRLSGLFSYHIRRDNIAKNPCSKLERIKVERSAPVILTPGQADTLIKITPRKFRPYVILGMFAGIRPEETEKLTWKDVCLETKNVTVNLAKTRRRRIVPMEPRAVSLLENCARKDGKITPSHSTLVRFKHYAREALGFDRWPQDLLRHTAASYLLALLGDAGKVATRLGNSSEVLLTHYHQPVKQADCEKFWKVSPCPHAPLWPSTIWRKYDPDAVRAFYDTCKSYKKTKAEFGISSSGTLHRILSKAAV